MKNMLLTLLGLGIAATTLHAGEEWYRTTAPTPYALRDVGLSNHHGGVAVGDSAAILITTNGGLTWAAPTVANGELLTNVNLRAVAVHPLGHAVAVGEEGRVARAIGGPGFTASVSNPSFTFNDVVWTSDDALVAVGVSDGAPLIARSSDRGATWTRVAAPQGTYTLLAVRFANPTTGIAVGMNIAMSGVGDGVVLRTTDGGQTWTNVYSSDGLALTAIALVGNEFQVFGVADDPTNGGYIVSGDLGASWTFQSMPELGFISSVFVANGMDVYALGHRFVEEGENVSIFATQFATRGIDRNWSISDIADGWQGSLASTISNERAIAVGDSGRVFVRWISPDNSDKSLVFAKKHIEFGATVDRRDSTVFGVMQNYSSTPQVVRSVTIHDRNDEWQLLDSYAGVEVDPGAALDLAIGFEPRFAGDHWAFLRIAMENGREHIIHLSGDRAFRDAESPITLLQPLYDFGDVNNPFGSVQNIGEIIRNDGNEPVTITNVEFEGEDLGAFALVDAILPFTLENGGVYNCEILFQPKARGLYRTTLKITVADTQIRVPLVGGSRLAGYNDVIDLGDVRVDSVAERRVWFSASEWDETFDVFVGDEPGAPFVVTDGDMLPNGDYALDIEARPTTPGVFVAPIFGHWGYGGESMQWVERKVLRMNATDGTTSVNDGSVVAGFTVAPQPMRETMTVRNASITGDVRIEILDVQGRLVALHTVTAQSGGLDTTVPVHDLRNGVYLAVVRTAGERYALPVIKR